MTPLVIPSLILRVFRLPFFPLCSSPLSLSLSLLLLLLDEQADLKQQSVPGREEETDRLHDYLANS